MLSVAVCASSSSYGPRYSGLSFPCRNSMAATVNLRATGNDSRSQVCTFLICGPLQNVSQLRTAWSGHSYQLLQGHGFKTIMSSLSKARPGKPDTSKMVSHQSPLNWSPNLNPFRVPKTDFFSYWVLVLQAASGVGLLSRHGSQVVTVIGLTFHTYDPKTLRLWAMIRRPSRYLVILMQST